MYDATGDPIGVDYLDKTRPNSTWQTYWFEKDIFGNVVALYDTNGTKIVSYVYDAWGNHKTVRHTTDPVAYYNPFRYRGYYYDVDLEFYYLQSRYYDPVAGRFISPDGVGYLGANGDINSFNLFAYCSNNPVMYVDPSGHSWEKFERFVMQIAKAIKPCQKTILKSLAVLKCLNEDFSNFNIYNSDIEKVYQSHFFSAYNGSLVIRHSFKYLSSGALFNVIILEHGFDQDEASLTIRHEYGHILQEREYGTIRYMLFIFLPSATYNVISRNNDILDNNYYNMPWEYDADLRGGVTNRMDYSPLAPSMREKYFDMWWFR